MTTSEKVEKIMRVLSDVWTADVIRPDFRVLSRKIIEALEEEGENHTAEDHKMGDDSQVAELLAAQERVVTEAILTRVEKMSRFLDDKKTREKVKQIVDIVKLTSNLAEDKNEQK